MNVEDIDRFIDRWRATLSPSFTSENFDGYMRRHRAEVEALPVASESVARAEGHSSFFPGDTLRDDR